MDEQTPAAGDNRPPYSPEKIDELKAAAEAATREAEEWLRQEIADDEAAEHVRDFLGKIGALQKRVTEAHRADKAPWLERGRQVDAAYAPFKERLERLAARVKPLLQAWWNRKEEERRARERAAAEAAEKARREAERQAALAARTKSIEAEEAAERARKEAEDRARAAERAAKERTKIASASGGARAASVRTRRVAVLRDINQAFLHYRDSHWRDLEECLTRLANADLRAKDAPESIPGFDIREEQTIA